MFVILLSLSLSVMLGGGISSFLSHLFISKWLSTTITTTQENRFLFPFFSEFYEVKTHRNQLDANKNQCNDVCDESHLGGTEISFRFLSVKSDKRRQERE